MIFRQLFDRETCTYTYLLADEHSREAILIDPVREHFERDRGLLKELQLTLRYTLETHVHADHVTASGLFRQHEGSRSALSSTAGTDCADIMLDDGERLAFGAYTLEARHTPGHTNGCVSYYVAAVDKIFTGDTLFVRGCGRTDFQQGCAETLFDSVQNKIFSLPEHTAIYPGHDYKGRTVTTVAEEKAHNPRLGGGRSKADFVEIMNNLNLAEPARIHIAVPANLQCGLDEEAAQPSAPGVKTEADWAAVQRTATGVPEVNTSFVFENQGDFRLVDVRQPHEFTGKLRHIDGAELVPLDTLERAATQWNPDEAIVVLCRSGGRSGRAARILEALGFGQVASMAGGMLAWNAEGRPTV